MTYAITGATGQLGRLVIEHLKTRTADSNIVALVRQPDKAVDLGVRVREFDYNKPDMLAQALFGVDTLLLISGSEVGSRIEQHRHVIEAARKADVKRIVYTSLLKADTSPISLADEHRTTEADLKASGLAYTLLRNSWYTENYTGAIGAVLENGALIGAAGDARLTTAPRVDYAEAAVAALVGSGHENRTYELAGDEPYTLSDLAAEISRQTGKTIPYSDLDEDAYANILTSIGLPEPVARMIAGADTAAKSGALFDDSHQLSTLIGRPTTPLSTVVRNALDHLDTHQ